MTTLGPPGSSHEIRSDSRHRKTSLALGDGADNQTLMPHAAVMFDDFYERVSPLVL